MRLLKKLLSHTSWLAQTNGQPITESIEGHRRTGQWYRDTNAHYNARTQSPHPRTIVAPAGNNTLCYTPGAPYHRMRLILGNGNYPTSGSVAVAGSRRLGDYATIHTANIPANNYTTADFDAKTIGSGDYYPTAYRTLVQATTQNAELGDLALYAYADLEPILADLIPIQSQYELSIFTPLSDHSFLAQSLTARAYEIRLLAPRTDPSLPWLMSLAENEEIELEHNGAYLPCSAQSVQARPAGGALWEITLQLQATQPYAYSPIRHINTQTHSSQADLHGYQLPGDAPAPTEIRLQITTTHNSDIELHIPATGEVLKIRPDAQGTWSIHDTGRIYHCPTGTPSTLADRTDILKQGALPITLPPGDGVLALAHHANWGIPQITLAAYPRYHPNIQPL